MAIELPSCKKQVEKTGLDNWKAKNKNSKITVVVAMGHLDSELPYIVSPWVLTDIFFLKFVCLFACFGFGLLFVCDFVHFILFLRPDFSL